VKEAKAVEDHDPEWINRAKRRRVAYLQFRDGFRGALGRFFYPLLIGLVAVSVLTLIQSIPPAEQHIYRGTVSAFWDRNEPWSETVCDQKTTTVSYDSDGNPRYSSHCSKSHLQWHDKWINHFTLDMPRAGGSNASGTWEYVVGERRSQWGVGDHIEFQETKDLWGTRIDWLKWNGMNQ